MKSTMKCKLAVDAAMTVALLLLMAYGLVGEAAHEWLGMGMFALFLAHHVLNRKWLLAIGKGKYTPLRIIQTALVGVILLCMLGSMVSGSGTRRTSPNFPKNRFPNPRRVFLFEPFESPPAFHGTDGCLRNAIDSSKL